MPHPSYCGSAEPVFGVWQTWWETLTNIPFKTGWKKRLIACLEQHCLIIPKSLTWVYPSSVWRTKANRRNWIKPLLNINSRVVISQWCQMSLWIHHRGKTESRRQQSISPPASDPRITYILLSLGDAWRQRNCGFARVFLSLRSPTDLPSTISWRIRCKLKILQDGNGKEGLGC